MTFTNDQLREIERVNLILLKKIMAQRKPRTNGTVVVNQPPRKTSSAINRARSEKNIEKDNMVSWLPWESYFFLLLKINDRETRHTSERWGNSHECLSTIDNGFKMTLGMDSWIIETDCQSQACRQTIDSKKTNCR